MNRPKAKIENYNGSPAVIIDGKPYPPMFATIRTNNKTHMVIDSDYYRNLGKSGIKIYFLICDTEWLKPGAYDMFCEEAEVLLREVPDAYIMLRIGMHPPVSWCKDNPDETLTYSDGKKKPAHLYTESYEADYPDGIYSFCSEKWRKDATAALLETLKRIDASPYADRVIGCFFAAGGTSEWYYITPTEYTAKSSYCDSGGWIQTRDTDYDDVYADLSPAFKNEFSRYLKEKYVTDENLRKAWNNDKVTIAEPQIPDCDARYYIYGVDYDVKYPTGFANANEGAVPMPSNGTNIGQFVDIAQRCDVFDFFRALHIGTANSVIYFGNAVKEYSKDMLTGAFYGSAGSTKFFGFSQVGGVDHILTSGVIDFLASPGVYENRQPGGFTGQRQNFDSYRLKNTMFLVEDDVRTHMENHSNRSDFELYSFEDTANVMKREFGRNICQDTGSWWFDQIIGGGRYKLPEIYDLIAKQQKIAAESYELDRRKNSEIAFIYDEESYHVISDEATQQMMEIFRNYDADIIGAPSDRYLHNDMENPNMPDYKLYVFFNTLYLTDKERRVIKQKLSKNHATALFMYGAGVINPDADSVFDEKNISDLTGINTSRKDGVFSGKFKLCDTHKMGKDLDRFQIYGDYDRKMRYNICAYKGKVREIQNNLLPLLYADDASAETVACFPDSGKTAVAVKDTGGYVSVYCGSKYINNEVMRAVADFAGCHIYCRTNDVLYANKNYITIHAASSGRKTIYLPKTANEISECYTNECFGRAVDEISFDMSKGETKMFRLK